MIKAELIRKVGYCLPDISCFFFKNFLRTNEKTTAIKKLISTNEKPSWNIGAGENKPLFDK